MTAQQLRTVYISFFEKHRHREISSKSLLPENDPTVLFTTAGMHPLVPYLMGQEHPEGKRLVNCQPCIRTGDIDEVGDDTHLTFFEMLGNWSLGDYFKREALSMSYEFLTECLKLDPERLSVTVFAGDTEVPRDNEAAEIWQELGIPTERIRFLPRTDNWWGPAGQTGPCGPDSEMFYDTGEGQSVEIWNDVFIEYNKTPEGRYERLERCCVDTGMGLERTIAMLNGKASVFDTEIFQDILEAIGKAAKQSYGHSASLSDRSFRIIADHLRASVMILGDPLGVQPSNLGQGYILRRLLRRAIRFGKSLGIQNSFLSDIAAAVIENLGSSYPHLIAKKGFILQEIEQEEQRFMQTLHKGEHELQSILEKMRKPSEPSELPKQLKQSKQLSGRVAFKLYDTYGFPLELTEEIVREAGLSVDRAGFEEAFAKHKEASKKGAEKIFKGGLADHSEMTTAYHTLTHLLHEALRRVLGEHITQKGSNITAERMRFDFSHPQALSKEELSRVEDLVNEQIHKDLPISCETMPLARAKEIGARALFHEQYDEEVQVYATGDFSLEVCGGPHVERTGILSRLGHFKIRKEQSSSQGVRRIKAVLAKENV